MFTFHQGNLTPKTGQEWLSCWRSVNGLASHRCYPFRPNKTKVTKSVFTRAYACVCVCVRACVCEDFPDVGDLVTLDLEIQALFWNFHGVQAVYYQLVVVNVSTA